jgi:Ca2+-binding EF-hand superfamily protein
MDADGDGNITKDEFMTFHEKMFSRKDKNGDGVIDASEMKTMMKEGMCGEAKCGANKK